MNLRRTLPLPIIFSLCCFMNSSIYAQQTSQKSLLNYSKPDYESFLSAYLPQLDPVWDTIHTYFYEGAFIGNGLVGAMVYRNDSNSLRWDINRADFTAPSNNPEYSRARFGLGKIVLYPKGKIISSKLRIDLWNGILRGELITTLGKIRFESFSPQNTTTIITTITNEGKELARFELQPEPAKVILQYAWNEESAKFEYPSNKKIDSLIQNGFKIYRQNFVNEHSYFELAHKYENSQAENKQVYITSINGNLPFSIDSSSATETFKDKKFQQIEILLETHQKWWHQFLSHSFVHIPDARLASFYWIQKYKMGSSFKDKGVLLDLMGPWYAYTPWPAIWWNLNVQLTYSPLYALNLLNFGETLYKTLDQNLHNLIANAPKPYQHNAAGIGRVTTFDLKGNVNLLNSVFPYYDKEPGNLQWVMHNYFTQYLYSMDWVMLKDRIFPLLKRSTNLYLNYIVKESDGKYHIPATFSPEYAVTRDANYDLSLLKWGCKTLIWIADKLKLKDAQYTQWKDVLDNLVDYPTDHTGLRIGSDTSLQASHRHYSHLLMIYPLKIMDLKNPKDSALMQTSIDHWLGLKGGHAGYTYTGAAGMNAMLHRGDSALKYLDIFLDDLPISTMYREAGPVIETPYAAITSCNEMLLQSYNGYIEVFPAIPHTWENTQFDRLRAEGAFIVSASKNKTGVEWVKLTSLTGEKCVIKLDFEPQKSELIKPLGNKIYQIHLKKNESITIKARLQKEQRFNYNLAGKLNYYGLKLSNEKSPKKYK